jgi:hypothetical protein
MLISEVVFLSNMFEKSIGFIGVPISTISGRSTGQRLSFLFLRTVLCSISLIILKYHARKIPRMVIIAVKAVILLPIRVAVVMSALAIILVEAIVQSPMLLEVTAETRPSPAPSP